ncbi:reverse transcriptase domain-containing protein [Tanacetum coccineum]
MDVFAWEPADMPGIPRRIIEHSLNVNPLVEPVAQKRRVMAYDHTQVVSKKVEEWVSAGIVRPVRYPTWISNLVLVKKGDGRWHRLMKKNHVLHGLGHTATAIHFGLKNSGATYQRLVDTAFQSQIRRNLEAYMDDMIIKSNNEKVLIKDIAETFDNLRRINMKLNPKKVRMGWKDGKVMGLSGKLAALKRFLSRSAERSLPFFETLKDITKENKDEYRWTKNAKRVFQEIETGGYEGKLAKYSVELGAYNIAYEPRSAMKGQVLVDFLSEALGRNTHRGILSECWASVARLLWKDGPLYDEASNSKGSGGGLALSPQRVELHNASVEFRQHKLMRQNTRPYLQGSAWQKR